MAEYLKTWLQQNKKENDEALKTFQSAQVSSPHNNVLPQADPVSPSHSLNDEAPGPSRRRQQSLPDPIPSTSGVQTQARESLLQQNIAANAKVTKPSELVFENNSLKMIVSQAAHVQEKRFKAQAENIFIPIIYDNYSLFLILLLVLSLYLIFRAVCIVLKCNALRCLWFDC